MTNKKATGLANAFAGLGKMLDEGTTKIVATPAATEKSKDKEVSKEPVKQPQVEKITAQEKTKNDTAEIMLYEPGKQEAKSVIKLRETLNDTFKKTGENTIYVKMTQVAKHLNMSLSTINRAKETLEKLGEFDFVRESMFTKVSKKY